MKIRGTGGWCAAFAALALGGCAPEPTAPAQRPHAALEDGRADGHLAATFSIVARDPLTGDLGVAVASKYFGVGSVVPWARAGVGAAATQALPNVAWGPAALALLAEGSAPADAIATLVAADPRRDHRQLGLVDAAGRTAAHTGGACQEWAGHLERDGHAVQGNLLAGDAVLPGMSAAFEKAKLVENSELADWLIAALRAGEAAGGDRRGRQSAALIVVRAGGLFGANDRYVDLRVEDHADPVAELGRLLSLHKEFFAPMRPFPGKERPPKSEP